MVTISRDKTRSGIRRILSGLRIRIILIVILCGLIPCLILQFVMLNNYKENVIAFRVDEVRDQCEILSRQMIAKNYLDTRSDDTLENSIRELASVINGRILVINSHMVVIADSAGTSVGATVMTPSAVRCVRGNAGYTYKDTSAYLEVATPITNGEQAQGAILVRVTSSSIEEAIRHFAQETYVLLAALAAAILILSILLGELLVRPILRVGTTMETTIETYDTSMEEVKTYSEMQSILDAVDTTMARMRTLDRSRQEFVSNVSHELKTPITSIKVLAESLVEQEEVPVEIYKEFMQDISNEIERESQIIEELLSLVRLDKAAALVIKSTYINDLLELLIKRLQPIAESRNIEIVLESYRPVMAEIDENKLGLAFTNLIENAIKYNKENGWVHVSLNSDHRYFFVKVSDSGRGIPKEDQEHVFERFYRGDKSHSSQISGTGLGLSITRNAVALHHGTIKLESEVGEGTTFTVRVPLHYQEHIQ